MRIRELSRGLASTPPVRDPAESRHRRTRRCSCSPATVVCSATLPATATKVTDEMSNPNFEQFDNRQVPFGGDYLWITSLGDVSFGTWTDWRNTVQGVDPRETPEDEDGSTADVKQCRDVLTTTDKKGNTVKAWSSDLCPHAGGLDQDIYGDRTP
jgi:hypothetical protein